MDSLNFGNVSLTADALKQHWAVLGITGSGKSYAVRGLVEQLLDRGDRVCIIDPKGDWSGLKSSADGKSAGYPVIIFGGDHADVPIDGHSGAAIGELVATGNRPCIIDLMHFSNADKARFAAAFMGELFRKNKGRLTLVLEEAHEFAPQRPMGEETMLLHWTNKLLSQGRSRGVQVIMASQRPAKVHKDSLTQAQVLIAMRSIAVQDRDATKDWVDGVGDKDAARKVMDSLARLEVGTGWLYAPGSNILEMVTFPRIKTFDSGATPDGHDVRIPTGWATVDLSDLSAKLASVKVEAESNDPKVLKKRIAELEAKVGKGGLDDEIQKDRRRAYQTGFDEGLAEGILRGKKEERQSITDFITGWNMTGSFKQHKCDHTAPAPALQAGRSSGAESNFRPENGSLESASGRDRGLNTRAAEPQALSGGNRAARAEDQAAPGSDLPRPLFNIIKALRWWNLLGIDAPSRIQVAFVAGYTPSGGTFVRYCTDLKSRGLIDYPSPGFIGSTAQTPETLVVFHGEPRKHLHEAVLEMLEKPLQKILQVALNGKGQPIGRTEVAEQAGYEASGGTFVRYCTTLKSLGLISYPKKTTIAAAAWLFSV
jgi:hypothetical protein